MANPDRAQLHLISEDVLGQPTTQTGQLQRVLDALQRGNTARDELLATLKADVSDAVTTLRWAQGHLTPGHAKRLEPLVRRLSTRLEVLP